MASHLVIGIDENGLGPRMGPLVVTGVRLRLAGAAFDFESFRSATGLDDSKRVFSPAHRDRGEAKALGVLAARAEGRGRGRGRGGSRGDAENAEGDRGLAAQSSRLTAPLALLLDELAVRAPWSPPPECADLATGGRGSCAALSARGGPIPRWPRSGAENRKPKTENRIPRPLDPADGVRSGLRRLGITVERLACAVLCPGVLNEALRGGRSKLAVDLRLFEVVATELRRDAEADAEVLCGKVGGTDRYAGRFVEWSGRAVRALVESRARSAYDVQGIGRVSFVRDGDATEPAVAMASVVGKYVRELWMDDLARAVGWAGPAPSGYHDEATARLEAAAREAIGAGVCRLPAGCVLRDR